MFFKVFSIYINYGILISVLATYAGNKSHFALKLSISTIPFKRLASTLKKQFFLAMY